MTQIERDRRRVSRYAIQVPIHVETVGTGVTHDISPSGVAFHIDGPLEVGTIIRFALTLRQHAVRMQCEGRIVRVDITDSGARSVATIDTLEHVAGPAPRRRRTSRARPRPSRLEPPPAD
jgi:hypothetical protein